MQFQVISDELTQVSNLILLFTHTVGTGGITQMKLQKLVYLCQSFIYAVHGDDLFLERPEAWVHGPVYRHLYNGYRSFGYKTIELPSEVDDFITEFELGCEFESDYKKLFTAYCKHKLNKKNEEIINDLYQILEVFADKTAARLREITHDDDAWIQARKGLDEFAPCYQEMDLDVSKKYLTENFLKEDVQN